MTISLKLTRSQMEELLNSDLSDAFDGRFQEVFNDIPLYHPDYVSEKKETHRDYTEKDGREYRWLIFKDTKTGQEYTIIYTYNPEIENSAISLPDSISYVDLSEDSDIF